MRRVTPFRLLATSLALGILAGLPSLWPLGAFAQEDDDGGSPSSAAPAERAAEPEPAERGSAAPAPEPDDDDEAPAPSNDSRPAPSEDNETRDEGLSPDDAARELPGRWAQTGTRFMAWADCGGPLSV